MGKLMIVAILAFISVAAVAALAQSASTPEERERLVTVAHRLESNPLDATLRPEREWAFEWLTQVPDITVGVCPSILGDYHKYKYSAEITTQLMLSGAEFVIQNPGKAKDQLAQYLASAEGALRAYSSILRQDPKARSKAIDEVLQKQSGGKLRDYVEDAANKSCRNPG